MSQGQQFDLKCYSSESQAGMGLDTYGKKVGRRLRTKMVSVEYQKVYERHLNSQNMIKGLQTYATGGVKDQRKNPF